MYHVSQRLGAVLHASSPSRLSWQCPRQQTQARATHILDLGYTGYYCVQGLRVVPAIAFAQFHQESSKCQALLLRQLLRLPVVYQAYLGSLHHQNVPRVGVCLRIHIQLSAVRSVKAGSDLA